MAGEPGRNDPIRGSQWCELKLSEIQQLNPIKDKRFRERFQLKAFIERFAEFPEGNQDWDHENPDLRVQTASGKLGIEHTSPYSDNADNSTKGSPKKAQESLQWSVIKSALTKYAESEKPPVSVGVWFDVATPLTGKTSSGVADAIAHAVQNIVSANGLRDLGKLSRREYERRFADSLPPEILRIELRREQRTEFVVWYPRPPSTVSELTVPNLQAKIQDKELRLAEYRKNCDEVWLLIASEGLFPSSNFVLSDGLRSHAFQTQFDRVFYFDSSRGDLLELKRAS